MFIFEDITSLDGMAIQRFLREVDSKDLVVALKGSNEDVNAAIFQNMSQRMGETVRSDMEYLHNVRMRDVEEAQQRIVAIIRKLEEEGEIVISKGGKDDIIV
jgi:flagellar motor switch protein FliG